ncbi:hypothetical protein SAMN05444166_0993 [Singulisphaera sp. GP187]|nr:hypothetical protein SAMN05444166_0993 [Singulisphaera sp. GP187]
MTVLPSRSAKAAMEGAVVVGKTKSRPTCRVLVARTLRYFPHYATVSATCAFVYVNVIGAEAISNQERCNLYSRPLAAS